MAVIQSVEWTNEQLLAQNRSRLMRETQVKLRGYEARYELSSSRVEEELAAGRLRETAEICDWVIALHTYQALEHEG